MFSKKMSFVLSHPDNDVKLPEGVWKQFECCRTRNKECLLSLCSDPTDPDPVTWETLERIHPKEHLARLRSDRKMLFGIFEIGGIKKNARVTEEDEKHILEPSLRSVGGIVLGTRLAYNDKSIVIVPNTGHHHASPTIADGSCLFSDVPLAWLLLRDEIRRNFVGQKPFVLNALYIDVDVHHANGFARTKKECGMDSHFFMVDLFNEDIWPFTGESSLFDSMDHVNIAMPFHSGIGNKAYLSLLGNALKRVETELPRIDMVFYMCSNDAMMGDPLGKTNVTERAIYQRDRMVVEWARSRDLPIVIMPSRGYGPSSCRVSRESMARLNDEYKIF